MNHAPLPVGSSLGSFRNFQDVFVVWLLSSKWFAEVKDEVFGGYLISFLDGIALMFVDVT